MSAHLLTSSPPHLLTLSAAVALVVLALLWPEERGTAAGRVRAGLFAVLAGVVGFVLAGTQADRAGGDPMARAFEAYTRGMIDAKQAEADAWLIPSHAPTPRRL